MTEPLDQHMELDPQEVHHTIELLQLHSRDFFQILAESSDGAHAATLLIERFGVSAHMAQMALDQQVKIFLSATGSGASHRA